MANNNANSEINNWSIRSLAEVSSGDDTVFHCWVKPGQENSVKNFLKDNIYNICNLSMEAYTVSHGGYGAYTRYDMVQHDYAGGGCSYIEVLEINNAPEDRCKFILNFGGSYDNSYFIEWETLEDAKAAYKCFLGNQFEFSTAAPKLHGFKRLITCGALTPWFYAVGEQILMGDYAVPCWIQDDPVYKLGVRCVVYDSQKKPNIKICMGARSITEASGDYYKPYFNSYRVVYFNDGTTWNENHQKDTPPRVIDDNEMWIVEAMDKFYDLLRGEKTEFSIDFINDTKFIGKIVPSKPKYPTEEGSYFFQINLKGKSKAMEGSVRFKPTLEYPNVVDYVLKRYQKNGFEVERWEIINYQCGSKNKKWSGVYKY